MGEAAARLLTDDNVGELEPAGGGVQAVVRDHDATFQPWVGIVDGAFTGDCDCGIPDDDLCAHAVATALTAFHARIAFSGAATPPGAAPLEPDDAHYRQAVQRLSPRQLADLVAEHAVRDRLFATLLLGAAGMLDTTNASGSLATFRAAVTDAAAVTTGSRWQISDVEAVGHRLAVEVEILCAHPATPTALDLVEEAIVIWDDLSGHLRDAHHVTRTEPEEIADPLLDAHRDLCERLDLDPDEIAERLKRLLARCHYDTVDIDSYADLLGEHADTITSPTRW
ncbi:hypothetical protein [Micromonospora endophytica]|uniref:hypothetical protein n=1 Tax=Micromonospora endophytica TaxID=515350 RepID=UPI0020172F0A|nr:hypothetical protein [Micromonospora endophytica]